MAISVREPSRPESFERHVKRLVWCALLGSIALLVAVPRAATSIELGLTEALGATVVVIAVLTVVRDVSRYVRFEAARRRDAAIASRQAGACRAADAIHDRVANLLSVTVGYVQLVAEDEHLPSETREQAQRALEGALSAARVVSAFRQSLGCESRPALDSAEWGMLRPGAERHDPANTSSLEDRPWTYDPDERVIRADHGGLVATVRPVGDKPTELRNGRLMAEAPALWEVVADAQQLAVALLAGLPRDYAEEVQIRTVLERINVVTERLEA